MESIELNRVRLDGGTQPRGCLDDQFVAALVDTIGEGNKLPPVEVVYDGADYWCWDGFHRCSAYQKAGVEQIECNVTPGTLSEAQWLSYGANRTNGLYRSNADKRRAVEAALRHEKSAKMTDSEIARHVGVSDKTVAAHRPVSEIPKLRTGKDGKRYPATKARRVNVEPVVVETEEDEVEVSVLDDAPPVPFPNSTAEIPQSERTGRDGRTINTANIGKAPRQPKGESVAVDAEEDEVEVAVLDDAPPVPFPHTGPKEMHMVDEIVTDLRACAIDITEHYRGWSHGSKERVLDAFDMVRKAIQENAK